MIRRLLISSTLLALLALPIVPSAAQTFFLDTGSGLSITSSPLGTAVSTPYLNGTYIKKNYFPVLNYVEYPVYEIPAVRAVHHRIPVKRVAAPRVHHRVKAVGHPVPHHKAVKSVKHHKQKLKSFKSVSHHGKKQKVFRSKHQHRPKGHKRH